MEPVHVVFNVIDCYIVLLQLLDDVPVVLALVVIAITAALPQVVHQVEALLLNMLRKALFGGNDTFFNPGNILSKVGIEEIFYLVVGPTGDHLGNLSPFVSYEPVSLQ